MKALIALCVGVSVSASADPFATSLDSAPAHNPKLAEYINSMNVGWRASVDPHPLFAGRTFGEAKKLMGSLRGGKKLPRRTYQATDVPDSFDARTKWSNCPTLRDIRDQSACGSCWAVAAAEAMSDRFCTYLGSDSSYRQIRLAAGDLMSCCDECGNGCEGGFPEAAWEYWTETGLVNTTCEPYPFPKCAHHMHTPKYPDCSTSVYPTPSCPRTCNDGTTVSHATKYKGENAWSISGESDFQNELYNHGPFEVTLNVYQDFEAYTGGVYKHVSGPLMGGHAVKVVGWGTDSNTSQKYWLIANSWNDAWGEDGYFRILRGSNECGIESDGTAGQPKKL